MGGGGGGGGGGGRERERERELSFNLKHQMRTKLFFKCSSFFLIIKVVFHSIYLS